MTNSHTRGDWKRLGTAVQAARLRRRDDGLDNTAEWADAVGRSSRVLLGLERGEPIGSRTLRRIEEELRWPVGYCDVILTDPNADTAPELARPTPDGFDHDIEPRPLDQYTPLDLLRELEDRIVELSMELHSLGRPATTSRTSGDATVVEAMSPAQRRALKHHTPAPEHDPSTPEAQSGSTGGGSRR